MRIETALARRDRALLSLKDAFSAAEIYGSTSQTLEANRHEILARVCTKCPGWVRQYLDGYWHALIDGAYRHKLIFGGFKDGRFYSTHSNRADYYEKNGIEPSAYADDGAVTMRGHYWAKHVNAGTPKPFFNG